MQTLGPPVDKMPMTRLVGPLPASDGR